MPNDLNFITKDTSKTDKFFMLYPSDVVMGLFESTNLLGDAKLEAIVITDAVTDYEIDIATLQLPNNIGNLHIQSDEFLEKAFQSLVTAFESQSTHITKTKIYKNSNGYKFLKLDYYTEEATSNRVMYITFYNQTALYLVINGNSSSDFETTTLDVINSIVLPSLIN